MYCSNNTKPSVLQYETPACVTRITSLVLFLHKSYVVFLHKIILFLQDKTVLKMSEPSLPLLLVAVPHIPMLCAYTSWKRATIAAVVEPDGLKANWSAKFNPARG